MQIFSKLIQRREPRNMIRTLFLGRLDHDRLRKAGGVPAAVEQAVAAVSEALHVRGTANARCASGWRGRMAWRTSGGLRSPRISAARRIICWSLSMAFPPIWQVPF